MEQIATSTKFHDDVASCVVREAVVNSDDVRVRLLLQFVEVVCICYVVRHFDDDKSAALLFHGLKSRPKAAARELVAKIVRFGEASSLFDCRGLPNVRQSEYFSGECVSHGLGVLHELVDRPVRGDRGPAYLRHFYLSWGRFSAREVDGSSIFFWIRVGLHLVANGHGIVDGFRFFVEAETYPFPNGIGPRDVHDLLYVLLLDAFLGDEHRLDR
mmetsp:Transcript_49568/g.105481  ORF Transcript_49568/g.105481 Transcript_49568/m.105481 type:complete len:214 (-) Transcript_49568:693-1334(-)